MKVSKSELWRDYLVCCWLDGRILLLLVYEKFELQSELGRVSLLCAPTLRYLVKASVPSLINYGNEPLISQLSAKVVRKPSFIREWDYVVVVVVGQEY